MANKKEMPACLSNKCGINLLYPHFANTYLLPFYAESNKILEEYGRLYLDEYSWNPNDLKVKLITCKNKDAISIFYGTDDFYKKSTKNLGIASKIIEATFSLYVPRFIFLPFDIKLFNKYYKNKLFGNKKLEDFNQPLKALTEYISLKKIIPSFSEIKGEFKSYSGCNFFSDTIPQSEQIKKKITGLNIFGNTGDTVKILYYSASYSIYLFNLYPEYLPVYLDILEDPNKTGLKDFFKTNNYIYCKYKSKCSLGAKKCHLKDKIEQFHIEIFNDAKDVSNNLTDVYLDYVSKDFKKIPFHILQDVDSFSKAITLHHLYTENEKKIKGKTLKKLVEKYDQLSDNEFDESLGAFLSTSKSFYFILILDYWTQKLNSIKFDDIEKFIPQLLLEKSFLSGRYYFLYKELFKLSYSFFISTMPETNRIKEVKMICGQISNYDIFSFYYDWVMKKISNLRFESKEKFLENIKISFDFIEKVDEMQNNKELKSKISFDEFALLELLEIKERIQQNVTSNKYPQEINMKLRNIIESNTASIDKG